MSLLGTRRDRPRGLRLALALAAVLALLAVLAATLLRSPALAADPAAGSWGPTGASALARSDHSATKLADGRVLAVGGTSGSSATASAELYDPATDRWRALAGLATPRRLHSATLIAGAKVLVAGGDRTGPLDSTEVYDPATNDFTPSGSLSVARYAHSATRLPGGKVLMAGGLGADGAPLASAEVYDPATGSFSPAGSLSAARSGHSATPIAGGRVLIAGGLGAGSAPLSSAEVYDPATGSFSPTGPLSVARSAHGTSPVAGGEVLMAGGLGVDGAALSSVEVYDPATGSFSERGSLPAPRYGHTATALSDGRVLLAGGRGADRVALSSSELYDPATGASTAGSSSTGAARVGHTATLLSDGRVLVVGGGSAEVYDPTVPPRFSPTKPRQGTYGTPVVLGGPACRDGSPASYCGKVLVAGNGTMAELYHPAEDRWSRCPAGQTTCTTSADQPADPSVNVSRGGATLTPLDGPACRGSNDPPSYCGKVLLVGGTFTSGATQDPPGARVELYDPKKGTWSSCDSPASARPDCPAPYPGGPVTGHSATLLPDGRVLVAGGSGIYDFAVTYYSAREDFYTYDPGTGRWSQRGALYNRRASHRAVLLEGGADQCGENCGKVLLAGGFGSTDGTTALTAELLDPARGVSLGIDNMITPRVDGHSATQLPGGKVLVAGGTSYYYSSGGLTGAEYFDPKAGPTGGWFDAPSLRTGRRGHAATLLAGDGLLIAGGSTANTAERYDPAAGRSSYAGQHNGPVGLSTLLPSGPRSRCGTSCGKVLLTGGSAQLGWLYTPNPEAASLGPASGPAAGGTPVTIEGRGLASVTSVRFGELEATSLTPDPATPDTKLVAISPPHPGGTVPVTVTSSGGSSQSTRFTYTADGGGPARGGSGSDGAPRTPGTAIPERRRDSDPAAAERRRARGLRGCLARVARRSRRERALARDGRARRRTVTRRDARRLRAPCLKRFGRTPGPIKGLTARSLSQTKVVLEFEAAGSDGARPPAARSYLVKQSSSPIRSRRGFTRAAALCDGTCRFKVADVGSKITLTITGLRTKTTYHFAVAARDNVSRRLGPRSQSVRVATP